MVPVPLPDYIQPNPCISRRGHSRSFCQLQTTKDYYKYSFFPLAIVQWNALPEEVVSSPNLDIFKAAVGKLQHPFTITLFHLLSCFYLLDLSINILGLMVGALA